MWKILINLIHQITVENCVLSPALITKESIFHWHVSDPSIMRSGAENLSCCHIVSYHAQWKQPPWTSSISCGVAFSRITLPFKYRLKYTQSISDYCYFFGRMLTTIAYVCRPNFFHMRYRYELNRAGIWEELRDSVMELKIDSRKSLLIPTFFKFVSEDICQLLPCFPYYFVVY